MTYYKEYLLNIEYQNRRRQKAEQERLAQIARHTKETTHNQLLSKLATQLVRLGEYLTQEQDLPEVRRKLEPQT